jgi:uncharacterized membrane protein YkoI
MRSPVSNGRAFTFGAIVGLFLPPYGRNTPATRQRASSRTPSKQSGARWQVPDNSLCVEVQHPLSIVAAAMKFCASKGENMKTRGMILLPASLVVFGVAGSPVVADPLDDILFPADANGVLPIERILHQARASIAGTILEIELEKEHGRLVYEVLVLTPDNKKVEIEYDARTGMELSRKVKNKRSKKED